MSKFCMSCGQEIKDGMNFCMNCGKQVNENVKSNVSVNSTSNSNKSKIAAGLLAIFFGSFGVHNFYLGYIGKAVSQLLITILSCGALAFVSSIWGIIEGIMILSGSINTDASGKPLGE